ncbi:indoleamine 2,3-dioxygenase 1 isoform X2 [Gouania willdenowi]|uniref:indoleamine 2,3-dioxygenase 1 isoform X2 n=1 Tax=Gouania willdenowi TaxID=441366 RepID=UPI0010546AB9|nr:indoleamine 2,3-dioxygenase 2-like isoform X2 [Gouania willdenowi]
MEESLPCVSSMASAETLFEVPFSLNSYHVSEKLGFVLPDPLEELPPYYQPWMDIALRVPELVHSHELRSHINKMPLLSSKFLQRHRELRLAHLALGMMTMGYVWQEGENDTVDILPCSLAVPYWEVSQRLGLPPILTHADAVLANWKKKDPEGNLELLVTLPGGESVWGFFMVTLLVELAAVPALKNIPVVINGVRNGDAEMVALALERIAESIEEMNDALKLMHGDSDIVTECYTFCHQKSMLIIVFIPSVRGAFSLLWGHEDLPVWVLTWKDNPTMPHGLIYEGVQMEPMEFSGGSAAQSSLLHCFDELLGVKHEENSGAFLTRMRNYMLPAHKQLIQDLSLQPSLRAFVQQQASNPLKEAFHLCVTKLLALRSYHINVVSRFITVQASLARQMQVQSQRSKAGEMISKAPKALEERGTGGSSIMTFLKTVRDHTKDACLSETMKEIKH